MLTTTALIGVAARVVDTITALRQSQTLATIRLASLAERYMQRAALVQAEQLMQVALLAKLSVSVDTTPTGEAQASKALRFTI